MKKRVCKITRIIPTKNKSRQQQKNCNKSIKMEESKVKTLNVCLLGLAFMFVFAAYQTMGNVETTILKCACNQNSSGFVEDFSGSGYTSLAIIYAVLAFTNWFTPSLLAVIGPKVSLIIGGLCYLFFISQMLYLKNSLLYIASGILGMGAALIWTAQGHFLTINSDSDTMARNSGIFWSILQCSLILGNTFIYFQFQDLTEIDPQTRFIVTLVLASICAVGVLTFFFLRPTPWTEEQLSEKLHTVPNKSPIAIFKSALKLSVTPEMLLLSFSFFYTGMVGTFLCGIYGSSLGFTTDFGSRAKSLVGLHGIILGIGETVGGVMFSTFGHKFVKRGRDPVVILGFLLHSTAFFLIFLNLPPDSPFQMTVDKAIITPNWGLAIFCSFLIGFGDSCFNTQVFSILGSQFRAEPAAAFAIFRFFQSIASATVFFYSVKLTMYFQLLLLAIFCSLGTITFLKVEWMSRAKRDLLVTEKSNP